MVQWGKPNSKLEKLHQVWGSLIIQKLIGYREPTSPDPENVYDKKLASGWASRLKAKLDAGVFDLTAECVDIGTPEKFRLITRFKSRAQDQEFNKLEDVKECQKKLAELAESLKEQNNKWAKQGFFLKQY